jgi:hypothetical protein
MCGALFLWTSLAHGFDHTHALWSTVLQKYRTDQGLVYYSQLKADLSNPRHEFLAYLDALQKVPANEYLAWSKPNQMAFLLNAYNAFTIKLIIDHYPLTSITDIGGWFWKITKKPWKLEFFTLLGGKIKSLDPIEQDYLRSATFQDYRIHAALNCASYSCPLLRSEPYVGERLDSQLDEQMKLWFSDKERNRFDSTKKTFYLSKIFDWYQEDFDKWGGGVREVVKKYAPEPIKPLLLPAFTIEYLEYNWDLNEAKKQKP